MRLLVTGAAGFIGTNFVYEQLKDRSLDRLVCLDALTYAGRKDNLVDALLDERVRFVHGNITNTSLLNTLFTEERFDAVVHFAAESHVDHSIDNPGLFMQTNVIGTQLLMDACMRHGIKRFHMISTDEVYGDLPLDRPDLTFSESSPIRPSSPYAASKASADLLSLSYFRTYGLPVTVSRCSNNYGPYQLKEKLIPKFISLAMEDQPLTMYGSGLNIRDWLHVADHCSAIDAIMKKGRPGEVYNIGGGNERRNIDIAKFILKQLRKPESLITYVKDRPGHDLRYAIDSSKIQRELGWRPAWDFDQGMTRTVQWYLENRKFLI